MNLLLRHISEAIRHIDESRKPFKDYDPGVGPYGEPQLIKLIVEYLKFNYPDFYSRAITKRVPDVFIPELWALEFKVIRPFGNNDKEAEHWSQNLIHPYPGNVSAISDVYKLMKLNLEERKGVIAITYEHSPPKISVKPLVESFEQISRHVLSLPIGPREEVTIENLIHSVHQRSVIYGWELTA